jgi:hypothetical protein
MSRQLGEKTLFVATQVVLLGIEGWLPHKIGFLIRIIQGVEVVDFFEERSVLEACPKQEKSSRGDCLSGKHRQIVMGATWKGVSRVSSRKGLCTRAVKNLRALPDDLNPFIRRNNCRRIDA